MSLPEGWAIARVDELAGNGGLASDGDWVESKDQDPSGEVRLTQLADIGEGNFRNKSARFMNRETADRLRCTYLARGDVLIARMPDPIGRACQFPGLAQPAVTAVDVMIWRTDGNLADPAWFVKWVNSPAIRQKMADGAGGTTRQRIAGGRIKELELPVPPLAEQRRIVAKLDALTARLARARAELDRVAILAQKMRNAILAEAFSASASIERIDTLCMVGTGSTPKRGEARYYVDGTIPWVTSGVVNQRSVCEPTEYVTEAAIKETNCKVFPAGSLLVALYGEGKTRGKVTFLEIAAATNQALAVLHTFDTGRVEPAWIRRFLESRYEMTRSEAAGGVQPNLNLGIVKAIEVPLPDLATQRTLIAEIAQAFARADRLEAEATRARALLGRLESALLANAFRGELVPQDPTDEPAQTLLDRIRTERAAAPKAKRGRTVKVAA